ncbi:uncharacterized protein [Periplaneta americana]|uniref:uncharacterized protein n=1 Tax=Periplaneta americana TaxID=6978 RepID=UPI0037E81C26
MNLNTPTMSHNSETSQSQFIQPPKTSDTTNAITSQELKKSASDFSRQSTELDDPNVSNNSMISQESKILFGLLSKRLSPSNDSNVISSGLQHSHETSHLGHKRKFTMKNVATESPTRIDEFSITHTVLKQSSSSAEIIHKNEFERKSVFKEISETCVQELTIPENKGAFPKTQYLSQSDSVKIKMNRADTEVGGNESVSAEMTACLTQQKEQETLRLLQEFKDVLSQWKISIEIKENSKQTSQTVPVATGIESVTNNHTVLDISPESEDTLCLVQELLDELNESENAFQSKTCFQMDSAPNEATVMVPQRTDTSSAVKEFFSDRLNTQYTETTKDNSEETDKEADMRRPPYPLRPTDDEVQPEYRNMHGSYVRKTEEAALDVGNMGDGRFRSPRRLKDYDKVLRGCHNMNGSPAKTNDAATEVGRMGYYERRSHLRRRNDDGGKYDYCNIYDSPVRRNEAALATDVGVVRSCRFQSPLGSGNYEEILPDYRNIYDSSIKGNETAAAASEIEIVRDYEEVLSDYRHMFVSSVRKNKVAATTVESMRDRLLRPKVCDEILSQYLNMYGSSVKGNEKATAEVGSMKDCRARSALRFSYDDGLNDYYMCVSPLRRNEVAAEARGMRDGRPRSPLRPRDYGEVLPGYFNINGQVTSRNETAAASEVENVRGFRPRRPLRPNNYDETLSDYSNMYDSSVVGRNEKAEATVSTRDFSHRIPLRPEDYYEVQYDYQKMPASLRRNEETAHVERMRDCRSLTSLGTRNDDGGMHPYRTLATCGGAADFGRVRDFRAQPLLRPRDYSEVLCDCHNTCDSSIRRNEATAEVGNMRDSGPRAPLGPSDDNGGLYDYLKKIYGPPVRSYEEAAIDIGDIRDYRFRFALRPRDYDALQPDYRNIYGPFIRESEAMTAATTAAKRDESVRDSRSQSSSRPKGEDRGLPDYRDKYRTSVRGKKEKLAEIERERDYRLESPLKPRDDGRELHDYQRHPLQIAAVATPDELHSFRERIDKHQNLKAPWQFLDKSMMGMYPKLLSRDIAFKNAFTNSIPPIFVHLFRSNIFTGNLVAPNIHIPDQEEDMPWPNEPFSSPVALLSPLSISPNQQLDEISQEELFEPTNLTETVLPAEFQQSNEVTLPSTSIQIFESTQSPTPILSTEPQQSGKIVHLLALAQTETEQTPKKLLSHSQESAEMTHSSAQTQVFEHTESYTTMISTKFQQSSEVVDSHALTQDEAEQTRKILLSPVCQESIKVTHSPASTQVFESTRSPITLLSIESQQSHEVVHSPLLAKYEAGQMPEKMLSPTSQVPAEVTNSSVLAQDKVEQTPETMLSSASQDSAELTHLSVPTQILESTQLPTTMLSNECQQSGEVVHSPALAKYEAEQIPEKMPSPESQEFTKVTDLSVPTQVFESLQSSTTVLCTKSEPEQKTNQ